MNKKEPRKANMELLRIVAMLGITVMHYLYWNQAILLDSVPVTSRRVIGSALESFCIPMVAVYVMISGYYDESTEFRWGRLLRLCAEVWFYSILIHLAAQMAGIGTAENGIWGQVIYYLPVMMGHYWFATAFIVMELFVPLLNAGIQKVTRKTFKNSILALLIYESVVKTILPFQLNQDRMGYDFGFFLLMFLIGAYLRTYGAPEALRTGGRCVEGFVVACLLLAAEQVTASVLHERTGSFTWLVNAPFHYNHLFAVAASVCLFLAFTHVRIPEGRGAGIIRALSPLTFGVYLIQCHADILPRWPGILSGVVQPQKFLANAGGGMQNFIFFLWMVVSVILVYAVCSVIDGLRKLIFDGVIRLCRK